VNSAQQQSAPRQDRFPSQADHPAMPSAMMGSIGHPPGQMATTARASRTAAAWAAHIRFWQKMLTDSGFTGLVIGEAVDTFDGAKGEDKARAYEVYGYAFMASRPPERPAGRGRR
jgi:hypothetical protein